MRIIALKAAALFLLGALVIPARGGEVLIYTGNLNVDWISKLNADAQAKICRDRLTAAGITCTWLSNNNDAEMAALAEWVVDRTDNGEMDVLILYGYFPETIYPGGNAMPDGSIAELFIESTDGDAIMNHADYMFYVSDPYNNDGGLMNMMDIPGITMWGDAWGMTVTAAGAAIAPTLVNFITDRPFHVNELAGEWYVEAALAQDGAAAYTDPTIVRDGNRGRLIPVYQTWARSDPKGAVAAEIIIYLTQKATSALALSGASTTVTGTPVRFTVSLADENGILTPLESALTVTLAKDSATGAFDTSRKGAFAGTMTSVTIPAGGASAAFYYKDTAAKLVTLSAMATGLIGADLQVNVLENVPSAQGEVAIYTGNVGWTDTVTANVQAQICIDKLDILGIASTWFASDLDKAALAEWVVDKTGNGELDVLILYGYFPESIYAAGNTQPDGSIAELFIESTDGDTIINHADYMFYVTTPCCNQDVALMNMMDIPGINMWDDWCMCVTQDGEDISPTLAEYQGGALSFWTSRPLHIDLLANDWFVEAALAESRTCTRAEPVVVRDGNCGRLVPIFQYANRNDPKGAVAAEVIAWLNKIDLGGPTQLGLSGATKIVEGRALKLSVQVQDSLGSPSTVVADTKVNLASTSATGKFDVAESGAFDGTVTSVTVAAGTSTAVFYYKDTTSGTPTVTASSTGLANGTLQVTVVARTFAPPGEVALYTGNVNWMDKAYADVQASICEGSLNAAGIPATWFASDLDKAALATWVEDRTGNGKLDVLVIYGYFPESIYLPPNVQPDGSIAELFIESTDGDAIINHGDWMFYVSSSINGAAGLQNMMDLGSIYMDGGDNPMTVTAEGTAMAPHLVNHLSDRPFHVDELGGDWIVEAALAQDAGGTRVDPCMVRDGPRGRLISMFQSDYQADPMGAVATEVITWLMQKELGGATMVGLSGATTTVTGTPVKFIATLQNEAGITYAAESNVTVTLTDNSATGAFDMAWNGAYDGSVTSVTIPAGSTSAAFYYENSSAGVVTLTAAAPDLTSGLRDVNVMQAAATSQGAVAIYTGNTGWIAKDLADVQAQICVDALNAAGIATTWFSLDTDKTALAEWVTDRTDNGKTDVVVLYGYFPETIYPAGNTAPDGSLAELFIESTDGDVFLNHADYMFYVTTPCCNDVYALQNMMDIPTIATWGDNTSVAVTAEGAAIAPSLGGFLTDRPMPIDGLAGDWFVEAALAENASGNLADPIIVRDGNRGRLIPVFQTMEQDDPKGAVAAEIITWLMPEKETGPVRIALSGAATTEAGTPIELTATLRDGDGLPFPAASNVTVSLATSSATGAFDTVLAGPYNGSVTSVTIPAGSASAKCYYKDTSAGIVTLTASAPDLASGTMQVTITKVVVPVRIALSGPAAAERGMPVQVTATLLDEAGLACPAASNVTVSLATSSATGAFDTVLAGAYDGSVTSVTILAGAASASFYYKDTSAGLVTLTASAPDLANGTMQVSVVEEVIPVRIVLSGAATTDAGTPVELTATLQDAGGLAVPAESNVTVSLATSSATGAFDTILAGAYNGSVTSVTIAASSASVVFYYKDASAGIVTLTAAVAGLESGTLQVNVTEVVPPDPVFRRGDANADGKRDIADAIKVLGYLFGGGTTQLGCLDAGDANDDGKIDIADAIKILGHLFARTGPLPAPFDTCDVDPTQDALGCEIFAPCGWPPQ